VYRESLQKKQKKFDAKTLTEGLPDLPSTGVEFIFRGHVLSFCNEGLVD